MYPNPFSNDGRCLWSGTAFKLGVAEIVLCELHRDDFMEALFQAVARGQLPRGLWTEGQTSKAEG